MADQLDDLRAFQSSPWSLLIIKRRQTIFRSNMSGIHPLLQAVSQHGEELDGATVFDKVIGRAAAFIIAYSRVKKVSTPVISVPALEILRQHQKSVRYLEKVARILDPARQELESLERLSLDATTPEQFLKLLQR